MPTCRYHPSEPADRVCAPCLSSKLHSLSRREGGIRRLVDSFHGSAYPDEEELPIFTLQSFGQDLEKKSGGTISALLRTESQRESAGFFSCGSEMSTRYSAADTHSEGDVKSVTAATPSRKVTDTSRRFKVEQLTGNFVSDMGNESSTSFKPQVFPATDGDIPQGHNLGIFSDRVCISDLITQSMRETDSKYRKPCMFSQHLSKRNDLKDPTHNHGICLKTPIWKFKLFSKSSPIWRLGLKGSKVSPSKRDGEIDSRGSHKESFGRHHVNNTRRLIASPPDDSVRLWCPSPMVTFKEGSFRWGKPSDKGSASCRRTGRELGLEPLETVATAAADQPSTSSGPGVFRRLFDLTHWKGNSTNRSETESTSSWGGVLRTQEIIPPRTQFDEEQAQLAANILSWMDGALATVQQPEPSSTCSTMAGRTGESISRLPEPEFVVS